MDKEYLTNPSLGIIASKVNYSENYFHRIFLKTFGLTPYEYMFNKRMEKAIKLLNENETIIKKIAMESGYDNEFYFSRIFKSHFGLSPSAYRQKNIKG
jgi:AraC-like DNA-binding protein